MEINNVLSIDIDVLFKDHEKFQKYFDTDLTPAQSWQVVKWKNELMNLGLDFEYEEKSLMKLLLLILKKCKKCYVKSIKEHDEIIKVLEQYNVRDCCLYNVDAHHDITYGNEDNDLNLENWVKHGYLKGLIKDYTWICRPDSSCPSTQPIYYGIQLINTFDVNKLPDFDLVVVCTSKHFTPIDYWCLNKQIYDFVKENSSCYDGTIINK